MKLQKVVPLNFLKKSKSQTRVCLMRFAWCIEQALPLFSQFQSLIAPHQMHSEFKSHVLTQSPFEQVHQVFLMIRTHQTKLQDLILLLILKIQILHLEN